MSEQDQHQAVLLEEAVKGLAMIPEGIYIDGTFGRGGHSQRLLASLSDRGRLFAIDKDPQAVAAAHKKFSDDARFSIVQTSFANLKTLAEKNGVLGKVNGVLLDLGVSSPQLDSAERGFSFTKTGPLDMRMDPSCGIDAATWINSAPEAKIVEVLKAYGEERFAKRIAKAIVHARQQQTISTTTQLAEIVKAANPKWEKHKHPATRTFQAIRIFINEELSDLETCLNQCLEVLAIGGRLSVISFHSLEDRIVKRFINHHAKAPQVLKSLPIPTEQLPISLRKVGKAIKASEQEAKNNPRARSAVLRVAEKIA